MECRHEYTMCRLCLCESESFIDIFQANEWFGYVAAEVIRDLLQFQVSETDGYPHVVCSDCLGKLTDFKQFKEKCQDSRDTYDNVFASDESHAEHPIDIEELRPVKLEPVNPFDTEEEAQQEISNCSVPFTPVEYFASHRKRAHRESHENTKNSANDCGKPSLKRRENAAVDANPCENIRSSGSAKFEVEKTDIIAKRDRNSRGERVHALPVEDMSRVALRSGEEFRRREDLYRSVDESEVEGGKEGPIIGANERERFRCNECSKDFEKKDVLIRHLELHGYEVNAESCGEERDFKVDADSGSDRNTNDVVKTTGLKRKAKRDEEGVGKYVCDLCAKGFDWLCHLKRHLRVHTGEQPFACDICGKRFNVKSSMRKHKLIHTGEKPYTCQVCCMRFTQKVTLISHSRVHTGEKPYQCEICGKRFPRKNSLVRHRRFHSGEKLYMCEVCGANFALNSYLVTHMLVHSGERPHECHICGKKFAQVGALTVHKRIHSGEKPYVCAECNKGFRDCSSLKRHSRVHSQDKQVGNATSALVIDLD